MVRATNAGGEAQSIADFAVFEPTPDTMVEVHKTVVYENVKEQGIVQVSHKGSNHMKYIIVAIYLGPDEKKI